MYTFITLIHFESKLLLLLSVS